MTTNPVSQPGNRGHQEAAEPPIDQQWKAITSAAVPGGTPAVLQQRAPASPWDADRPDGLEFSQNSEEEGTADGKPATRGQEGWTLPGYNSPPPRLMSASPLQFRNGPANENTEETRGPDDKPGGDDTISDPATAKARDRTLIASPEDDAKKIIAEAAKEKVPDTAIEGLSHEYASASADVKKAILADPGTKRLLNAAAKSVNSAFDNQPGPQLDAARVGVFRLNELSQKLEPELAGALAENVFQGHEEDYRAILKGGTDVNPKHTKLLEDTLARIAGSPQGQNAITLLLGKPLPAESQITSKLLASLPQNEKAAFQHLIDSTDFKSLNPEARLALVSQARNYPDIRSIRNLELLAARPWFRNAITDENNKPTGADQKRAAKLVAFASQYSGGNKKIMENTLARVLSPDGPVVGWDHEEGKAGVQSKWDGVKLDRDEVTADNEKVKSNDEIIMCTEVLAHEINHDKNPGDISALGTYRNFMDEYRAFYVGYQARTGHPPSQQECWDRATVLITNNAYDQIVQMFWTKGWPGHDVESPKMVKFIARIIGEDPSKATTDSVAAFGLNGTLSKTKPGLPPEKADKRDVNNLDNH